MGLIVIIVVGFIIFSVLFYVVLNGYSQMDEDTEKLKEKLLVSERELERLKSGGVPVENSESTNKELTRIKDELATRMSEIASLRIDISQTRSQELDITLKDAQLAVKDKEIRRLTGELQEALSKKE